MTTKEIGGWAQVILDQDREAAAAAMRLDALYHRLGRSFVMAQNTSYTPEKKAAWIEVCECLANEILRVKNDDDFYAFEWEAAFINEAKASGIDLDLADELSAQALVRYRTLADDEFAANVSEYALQEFHK